MIHMDQGHCSMDPFEADHEQIMHFMIIFNIGSLTWRRCQGLNKESMLEPIWAYF